MCLLASHPILITHNSILHTESTHHGEIYLSPGYISYIENGSKIPSLDTIVHIANALEITPDVLLESELVKKERTIAAEYAEIMESCTMLEKEIVLECSRNLVEVLKKNKIVSKVH